MIHRHFLMTAIAAGAFVFAGGASNATDVISAESEDGSSKVRIYRPSVSQVAPEPEPKVIEPRVVVNVPIYVTNRYRRYGYWRRYQGSSLAFGPRFTGFDRLSTGPRYPF